MLCEGTKQKYEDILFSLYYETGETIWTLFL